MERAGAAGLIDESGGLAALRFTPQWNGNDLSLPPGRYRAEDSDRPEQAVEFEVDEGDLKDVVIDR